MVIAVFFLSNLLNAALDTNAIVNKPIQYIGLSNLASEDSKNEDGVMHGHCTFTNPSLQPVLAFNQQ